MPGTKTVVPEPVAPKSIFTCTVCKSFPAGQITYHLDADPYHIDAKTIMPMICQLCLTTGQVDTKHYSVAHIPKECADAVNDVLPTAFQAAKESGLVKCPNSGCEFDMATCADFDAWVAHRRECAVALLKPKSLKCFECDHMADDGASLFAHWSATHMPKNCITISADNNSFPIQRFYMLTQHIDSDESLHILCKNADRPELSFVFKTGISASWKFVAQYKPICGNIRDISASTESDLLKMYRPTLVFWASNPLADDAKEDYVSVKFEATQAAAPDAVVAHAEAFLYMLSVNKGKIYVRSNVGVTAVAAT